jgi:archaellum component FlaC
MKNRNISLLGFRPLIKKDKYSALPSCVGHLGECHQVNINHEDFYLGTLNTMMMNLDDLAKYEQLCDNLIKRVEKTYGEISQGGPLNEKQVENKRVGNVSMYKFLKEFEWDDLKFPRSGDIIQPIKEKLISLEKSLKMKIQDYQDAKNSLSMMGEDNTESMSMYTLNLNDLVSEMEESQKLTFKDVFNFERMLGEKSRYLKNVLVFIPKNEISKFQEKYVELDDAVVDKSFQILGSKKDYIIGRVVYFKDFGDGFESKVKEQFRGICREFEYSPDKAKRRKEMKFASKINQIKIT